MKRRDFIQRTGLFAAAVCMPAVLSRCATTEKPNVLVIVTDDQGWADIGYNNPNVYTPHLDKLATEGAVFSQHYSMPQCTPTRTCLFTGRYPGRFGNVALQATNANVFPIGTPTMASMFKAQGYHTAQFGKWHMGSSFEHGPNNFGFAESYGSLAGAVGMYDHRYREGKYELTWHRNHQMIPGHENGKHATDLVARAAGEFIRKQRNKPFFMYLAFHAPHTPLDERGEFVDQPTQLDPQNPQRWLNEDKIKWFHDPAGKIQREPDPEKRLFLAVIYHLDAAIGQVVQALDDTGQRQNTLILFTSDNGPQVNWGGDAYPDDLKLTDFNQPDSLRGHKRDVWEGGIHVPGFANWPGRIKPTRITDPTHVVDFFPTCAKLIDFPAAESVALDGTDLSPVLFGKDSLETRDLYWIWGRRTNRWALRYGDWKIVKYGIDEPREPQDWELYNLKQDYSEEKNLADRHPEIVAKLHRLFRRQRAQDLK